jgi:hypothetical protein
MIGLIHGSVDQFELEIFRAYDRHSCVVMSLRFALRLWNGQCWLSTFVILWNNYESVVIVVDMFHFSMLMSFWKPNNICSFHHWQTNQTFTFKSKFTMIPWNNVYIDGCQWRGRPADVCGQTCSLASCVDTQVLIVWVAIQSKRLVSRLIAQRNLEM